MIQRRSLLAAMLLAGTAPAIVRAGVLMPVRQIIMPPELAMPPYHVWTAEVVEGRVYYIKQLVTRIHDETLWTPVERTYAYTRPTSLARP